MIIENKLKSLLFFGSALLVLGALVGCDRLSEPTEPPEADYNQQPLIPLETAKIPESVEEPNPSLTPELPPVPDEEPLPEEVSPSARALPSLRGLVPFRDSWVYQTILNWRPADGSVSTVNPPRFSWPYLKDVVAEDTSNIPPQVFTLQIARDASFTEKVVEVVDTPYNFYNALPTLDPGTWYWRVGYGLAPSQEWSQVRHFIIDTSSVAWDRSGIEKAAEMLAALPHPRTGPANGDWSALLERLQADPSTKRTLDQLLNVANRVTRDPWWTDFPETDRVSPPPKKREEQTRFIDMLRQLTVVAYAYRLTGEERYQPALEHILTMASWPMGGLLSPEAEGARMGGHTKMPSQAAELFAAVYDMFYPELTPDQRETLLGAVNWRLEGMFGHPSSIIWTQAGRNMRHFGLAYSGGSHPFQNFTWAVPAILLTAGDSEIANKLLPLTLNYLAGVTVPDGPDEGYNEGHGYSNEKAETMLRGMVLVDMLLPGLEMGKNPAISGLVDWFHFLFPGANSLPWGDTWQTSARDVGGTNLLRLTYLTNSPVAKHLWIERAKETVADNPAGGYSRPWFELAAWDHYREALDTLEPIPPQSEVLFLPEAGWLFVQSPPIATREDFDRAVGMQFQMRPRGGYGHSYASDGSFFWHAFGQEMNGGGGWQSWASLGFSRSPMSHNTLLVEGRGHDIVNPYQPQRAFTARPLVFEEGEGFVYWAADLTEGFRHLGPVQRIHRHVLFLDGRWFFIIDDLAIEPEADPVRFTFLYHIPQEIPVELSEKVTGLDYQIGGVQAAVRLANPSSSVQIENRQGRAGYQNPITGEDLHPADIQRAQSRGTFKRFLNQPLQANNFWITNTTPTREFRFFTALLAAPLEEDLPEVLFDGEDYATLRLPDGQTRTVSLNPARAADVVIDLRKVREHAASSRPQNLPAPRESTGGGEVVEE